MTTLWILLTLASVGPLNTGPFHIYQTYADCQAQIDRLPRQQRESISGATYICSQIIIHDGTTP